jgi:ATP-binding cassette subfamily C protein LapB
MKFKTSLKQALNKLAQLQGVSIDPLKLDVCMDTLQTECANMTDLVEVCSQLDFSAPALLDKPDRVYLPLMVIHPDYGWGVVFDQDAHGLWVLVCSDGLHHLDTNDLIGTTAIVNTNCVSHLVHDGFQTAVRKSLREYRGVLIEAALATVFMGMLTLAISFYSMQVYDRVIPTRSEATLIILSLGVVIAISLELVMKFARSHIMDAVVVGMDNRLSRAIFQRLLNVRIDQLPGSVGSLAAQIRGYEQVRSFYTASTLFTLVDFPISLLFIVIIGFIGSPLVAAVALCYGVIAILTGLAGRRRINQLAAEGAQANNLKTGLLVEAVEGAETIKAGAGSWKFLSRWINVNTASIHNDLRMRHTTESLAYFAAMLQQLSYASLVALGSWGVMNGQITMGAVIATSILSGRIMAPILAIPGLMVQHAHAKAATLSLEKLYALKSDHHGVSKPLVPSQIRGHFVLQDVKFGYANSPIAISIPRLEIRPGEKIGILGPIGAGKSTLLRLLAGMYVPQEGRVLLDGLELSHISRQVVSRQVGYLQQDHRLFLGTLRDNLLIGLPDPGDDALQTAMTRSGLNRLVATHPKGLDLPIMEGGKGLSGGQRQLVAFTRLLLCNQSVLLLDEPTASMDEEQERRCLSVLSEEVKAQKTLIVVTHKASIFPLIDRLIVVAGNQIVLDGPRDSILARLSQGTNTPPPGKPPVMAIANASTTIKPSTLETA